LGGALQNVKDLGSNWVIISPGWHYLQANPPVLSAISGKDALLQDLDQLSLWANQKGLKVAVFPQSNQSDIVAWWASTIRDERWWNEWFDVYTSFLINFADYAQRSGSVALILGEPGMWPALPDGNIENGSPSELPVDVDSRWQEIILHIRQHYQGQIIWALSSKNIDNSPPNFLQSVDQIYYLYDTVLDENGLSNPDILTSRIGQVFDEKIYPFQQKINKPIIIGVQIPSVSGATKGCYSLPDSCKPLSSLENEYKRLTETLSVDLQVQQDAYLSFLLVINQRNWVNGFIARGFYPPVGIKDISPSIRDKPAEELLRYWFSNFNQIQ